MAAHPTSGSPAARPRSTQFTIHDEEGVHSPVEHQAPKSTAMPAINSGDAPAPLITSKMGNLQAVAGTLPISGYKSKLDHSGGAEGETLPASVDGLLAKLSEQQAILAKQKNTLTPKQNNKEPLKKEDSSPGTVLSSPVSDSLSKTSKTLSGDEKLKSAQSPPPDSMEMVLLKKELDAAKNQIARQNKELSQARVTKHTFDQVPSHSSGPEFQSRYETSNVHHASFNPTATRNATIRQDNWSHNEDARSEFSDAVSAGAHPATQNIWSSPARPAYNAAASIHSGQPFQPPSATWGQPGARPWSHRGIGPALPSLIIPQQQHIQQRNYSGPMSGVSPSDVRTFSDYSQYPGGTAVRRPNGQNNRNASLIPLQRNNGWDMYSGSMAALENVNATINPNATFQPIGLYPNSLQYQPRPIGTPLSPTAEEFRTSQASNTPWNTAPPSTPGQTYVSPMEPLNYRRLLDRSVTCNWKYIVDKIVCNNDQQASIFLQQKLKVGTVEQKYEIIEAIVAQAYPLMVNRFGNFLVQRCFEHGTPEQVTAIANAIRGNTLSLSMDSFGCHVVQKAFDAVPEEYKAIMVHELLRRIPETVIHRYACHVWQKLFELRWSDSPPQIMKYVNEALRGMWHDVALGETGSLVVQNIFENCLEEDKRPCINEVLASIDIVAHGQFGNWCIQHICEHGLPSDRSRAIDHVLRYATEYSMDQFASKVVEKCLKIGGADFLERYLERVCEGRADRPRIPLIDIASDQYGNYLIQYILTHANPNHRDIVASHIRKHMVSLRGSKFGSRVGMLCCNPAYATHPGPGVGLPNNRFVSANNNGSRFNGSYR